MKKTLIATLAVFIAWEVLDYVIHGVILASSYEATANLWRPMEEMMMGLMYFVVLVSAFVFVSVYDRFVSEKNLQNAIKFGAWLGLGAGISMGYGSYAVMPMTYNIALVWFLGSWVEFTAAGVIVGYLVKE